MPHTVHCHTHTQRQMEKESLELGIWDLPEGCIAHIFSLVSPRDACKCSAVSSKFRLAADSDAVWEMFLPSHWEDIISRSVSPVEFSSLKALYFHLSHSPILLDHGKKVLVSSNILTVRLGSVIIDNPVAYKKANFYI